MRQKERSGSTDRLRGTRRTDERTMDHSADRRRPVGGENDRGSSEAGGARGDRGRDRRRPRLRAGPYRAEGEGAPPRRTDAERPLPPHGREDRRPVLDARGGPGPAQGPPARKGGPAHAGGLLDAFPAPAQSDLPAYGGTLGDSRERASRPRDGRDRRHTGRRHQAALSGTGRVGESGPTPSASEPGPG